MLSGQRKPKARRKRTYTKYKQHDCTVGDRKVKVQGYEPQAIKYLTEQLGIDPADIKCEAEFGDALRIRYKYRGKIRTYYPDIYIVSKRAIVEVKSSHTLGLLHNKQRGFSMTQAKAIACHEKGFKFLLLLLDQHGNRTKLPKGWPHMKKEEVIAAVERINPIRERVGLFQM